MTFLNTITVLALEQATVVPYLTYRLAQDGMTVVRIEHPVYGDPNRFIGDNVLGEERMGAYFLCINAGKKAITLNLACPEGKAILTRLITELNIDVFVTNQLPRNYAKLGISYETLSEVKPDIIWMGVTGFGADSNEGAYDPILQARSGLMELTGEADGSPQVVGIPLPDMGTSEHGYGLLMKALFKRSVTGRGSRIDLSMFESSVSWLTVPITLSKSFGQTVKRRGNTHEFFCPVSVYRTADGYIYLAVGNDRQWQAMTALKPFLSLDKPEYRKNSGRIRDVANLNQAINTITRQLPSEELIRLFTEITVPVSTIRTVPDVIRDPLVKKRLLSATDPETGTSLTLAPAPNLTPFLSRKKRTLSFPPRFGEHNKEIYEKRLGFTVGDVEAMKADGIL